VTEVFLVRKVLLNAQHVNMEFWNVVDENTPHKICSKSHCKTLLPSGYQYKQCDTCRTHQRGLSKKHQIKIATAEKKVSSRNKCPCEDGQCEAERPAQQARANEGPETIHAVEDKDEDNDGLPFGDFEKTV